MANIVVVGAGIAGLTAAYYAIKAGHAVTVLEADGRCGGAVEQLLMDTSEGPLGGDGGAESYAARSTRIDEVLEDLGLADAVVRPNAAGSWLYLPEIGAVPAPKLGMWGIPGDPHAAEVVAALGAAAATRAAKELDMPMNVWAMRRAAGTQITVGDLIADRFGPTVVERLVAPVVAGVHSADPYDVDIERIAPGLIDKAIAYGSVAKAVAALRAAAPPGAAVKSLRGGLAAFAQQLASYIRAHGNLKMMSRAVALDAETRTVFVESGALYQADHIVLAVDAPTAYDLLSTLTPASQRPGLAERPAYGAGVGLVMLALDLPELDSHPRGTGILVSPSVTDVAAKAATHVTAKWDWVKERAMTLHQHRHIVRLSYGRVTDPTDGSVLGYETDEVTLRDQACVDIAKIFDLEEQYVFDNVSGDNVIRWRESIPLMTPENSQRIAAVQAAVDDFDWLHVTGAWFAGTGLAAITQHTSALTFNPVQ